MSVPTPGFSAPVAAPSQNYVANLYPVSAPVETTAPALGICLSGGGSRALTCALGQLSALAALPDPDDPSRPLLNPASYISSVSGGSWAAVLYTFLPANITDTEFLITPLQPNALTAASLRVMPATCMGSAPQRFDPGTIAEFLYLLWTWGFFNVLGPDMRNWFWIAAVGELILKPFGLYSATYSKGAPFLLPDKYFSLSSDYVQRHITPENPTLDPSLFHLGRAGRPSLIVNANMQENDLLADPPQIPVQATPIATCIPGQSPDATIVGGGGVESFAFSSALTGPGPDPKTVAISANRRYALCDIAGCSSAFFAEYLLQWVNGGIDQIAAELDKRFHLSPWLIKALAHILESLADEAAAEVLPQYNYWPLAPGAPQNKIYGFSDGGNFDNTGILGLLAQTNANRVIAFLNSDMPLSKTGDVIGVHSEIPLLFGFYTSPTGQYVSYGGMSPSQPMSYVQVFSNSNGEFEALLQGLYDASCGGSGKDSALGTYPAAFQQKLTTVANPVANIAGDREVTVLWVYNNRVNQWQNQITDSALQAELSRGQSGGGGPLANFPHYDTVKQIYLAPEAVNLLGQLSAWNVLQLKDQIAGFK